MRIEFYDYVYGFLFLITVLTFFELLLKNPDLFFLIQYCWMVPIKEFVNKKFLNFLFKYLNFQFAEYILKDKEIYLLKEKYICSVNFA